MWEIGVTHGALKYYFPGKDAIIEAAFEHAFAVVDARVTERVGESTGLAALRAFFLAVLPLDRSSALEARIAVVVGEPVLTDAGLAGVFADAMDRWRAQVAGFLGGWPPGRRGHVPVPGRGPARAGPGIAARGSEPGDTDAGRAAQARQVQVLDAFLAGLATGGPPEDRGRRDGVRGTVRTVVIHRGPDATSGFLSFAEVALDRTTDRCRTPIARRWRWC